MFWAQQNLGGIVPECPPWLRAWPQYGAMRRRGQFLNSKKYTPRTHMLCNALILPKRPHVTTSLYASTTHASRNENF